MFNHEAGSENIITKTIENDRAHHKTITTTSGPGFKTVVIAEMIGNNNQPIDFGDPIIIPMFQISNKIHLKRVNNNENPFKVFHDLDSIFENFLDGFAQRIIQDSTNGHHIQINSHGINDLNIDLNSHNQNILLEEIKKLDEQINNEENNLIITDIKDVTNEIKEYY